MNQKTPVIGLTSVIFNPNQLAQQVGCVRVYADAILRKGGAPFLLPITENPQVWEQYLQLCDGFLFTGGADISPCFYGEAPSPKLAFTSLQLDRFQIPFCQKAIQTGKPILAICRGHQVLNVACGGSLYQDVTDYSPNVFQHAQTAELADGCHTVWLEPGSALEQIFGASSLWTNSYHHQSVKALGQGLKITARTEDGIVEGIELEGHPFGIGIQWHPEKVYPFDDSAAPIFEAFVQACRQ